MKTKTKIDTCVVALRDLLRSELGTIFVCLYHHGSRLSGDADLESDYDVVCVTSRQLTRQEKNHLVDRSLDIQFERGVVFDLHFYSRTEIATPPLSRTPFLVHLQEEGVLV